MLDDDDASSWDLLSDVIGATALVILLLAGLALPNLI